VRRRLERWFNHSGFMNIKSWGRRHGPFTRL
jgi:hypothetical protein